MKHGSAENEMESRHSEGFVVKQDLLDSMYSATQTGASSVGN